MQVDMYADVVACWVVSLQEKNVKHTGNISMDDVVEIARIMRPRSCAKNLAGTCKEILGTAVSVGCTVEHQTPMDVIDKVRGCAGVVHSAWLATQLLRAADACQHGHCILVIATQLVPELGPLLAFKPWCSRMVHACCMVESE